MAVYLDDQPVQLDGSTLGDVLQSASAQLAGDRRMVVEVQLDGQPLVGEALTQQASAPVPDEADLRLYSAQPQAVAAGALEQVRQQLAGQQPALNQAADLLQQDKSAEAFAAINAFNEVWLRTMQAIEQASQLMGIDLTELIVDDQPFTTHTGELFTQLQQLRQQVADRDTAALADSLAYEWPDILSRWDGVLAALIEAVDRPNP